MANETEIINDLWFKIHGLDEVNKTMKDMKEAMKDFNNECAIAEESASKVVKSFTTLGKMPMPMSNISPAVYSNRHNKQVTSVFRNTHATESHYAADLLNNPGIDYTSARIAWKATQAEIKKQQKIDEQMTNLKAQISSFLNDELKLSKDIVNEKKKQKERLMTENQRERNERSKERNVNSSRRNEINSRDVERKWAEYTANTRSREFRNKHPELYATGGQYFNARYQTANAIIGMGNAVSLLGGGGRAIELLFNTIGSFVRSPIAGTAAALINLTQGVTELGQSAIKAYAEIEAIKTQLGVVFSNQTQADSVFGQISQYAVKSPFGVQQTSELAVLLKQSGVYASDLMNTLKMLGDTAGGNMEKMKRIANNYAQIVSIGKASMLDMRQFAYAGIPIFEAVSKELGVSQQELRKLISDGKVTSDIIEKVFKDLTGINGIFNEATSKGAKTLKARLQNLKDATQLALGSVGEWAVNTGTKTGNDSYANRIVSSLENLATWVHDKVDTRNIEKSVKVIENRNTKIDELRTLIEENKENKEIVGILQRYLDSELSKKDIDAERSKYNSSYLAKTEEYNSLVEQGLMVSAQTAEEQIQLLKSVKDMRERQLARPDLQWEYSAKEAPYSVLSPSQIQDQIDIYERIIQSLKDVTTVTEEDIRARRESTLIDAQQLAFDKGNKASDASGSYSKKFAELYSIERNQKAEEEQQKHIKELLDAQQKLKELRKFTTNGVIDATSLGYQKFGNYMTSGVLTPGRMLQIVEGKSSSQQSEDRKLLTNQYMGFLDEIRTDLYKSGNAQTIQEIEQALKRNPLTGDNPTFFRNFSALFSDVDGILKNLSDRSSKDKRENIGAMRAALLSSTMTGELVAGGDDADVNAAFTKNTFIPLWKRILAQYTGLTTTGMTDTMSTLKNYRDDMAIRNLSAGVLSATLKENGLGAALGLIRGEGVSTLKGDTSGTIQTDWLATKQNLHDFALSLSSATSVVSAYKKGLEDELEVYQQLIVAGSTQGESQDANQQKYLTNKQLQKMKLSNAQLVNAFGDTLTTTGGSYKVSDLAVNDEGLLYIKSTGEIIKDQIKVESNLSRFLQGELPRLTKEIHEANAAELNNQYLNKQFNETVPTQLTSLLFGTKGVNDVTKFLANNSSYMMTDLQSVLKNSRIGTRFADTATEDIIALGLKGRNKDASALEKEALALLIEALGTIIGDAKGVVAGDDEYERYGRNQKRDEALNDYLKEISNIRNNDWAKNLEVTPYNYSGYRGVSARLLDNGFGLKQSFDIQDLYNQRASELGVDKLSFKDKLGISYGEKGLKDTVELVNELSASLETIALDFGKSSWVKPFETMAENLALGKDALDGMKDVYKGLTAEMLNASGAAMQKAGWELVAMGAADRNVGMIAGGLALAAAGGAAAGLGSALNNTDSDDSDDKTKRLEDLKDDLADLLRQARNDAIYYENTLRHKKAISANNALTMTSVHDAVITPSGQVVKTDPKDYLLATKTPKTLVGGGSPTINFNVIDKSTGIRVAEQRSKYNPETNTLEFTALIENKVKEVIATSAGDDAFAARAARQQGRIVIA